MAIREWPAGERPREKLLTKGADSLSDAELLALFIRTGVPGKTAVDVGRDLLKRFGGLRGTLTSNYNDFCDTPGLGPAKYVFIQAALEMARRFMGEKLLHHGCLKNLQDVTDFLLYRLRDKPQEIFAIIYLDSKHQILHYEELFVGTLNQTSVYPREVVKKSLANNAAAVIVTHNHPSGRANPSEDDKIITRALKKALDLVDIKLLDHIVVGDGEVYSLSQMGLM